MKAILSSLAFILFSIIQSNSQTLKKSPEIDIYLESIELENGNRYLGQTMTGKPYGIGTIIEPSGKMTTGYFNDGKWVGPYIVNSQWHMVDIFYSFKDPVDFKTFSIDLDVKSDIPQDINLYISPFGGSTINHRNLYGGIQTNGGGYKSVNHNDDRSEYYLIQRSMIFSRWEERDGKSIKMAQDGYCESGGYEGDFVSVRNRLEWKKGKYTFTLKKTKDQVEINGETHTFVEMTVFEHSTQKSYSCGALAFPGTALFLGNDHYIFFEIYNQFIPIEKVPVAHFEINNIKVNGAPVELMFAGSSMKANCPRFATVLYKNNGSFFVEIGKPHQENDLNFYKDELYQVFVDKSE